MRSSFLVATGGGLGSVLRYWISNWTHELNVTSMMFGLVDEKFPIGTLVVNVFGSFIIGLVAFWPRSPGDADVRLFFMVGICGGFTTFSSFSLQNLMLLHQGHLKLAALNIGASVILCLLAVFLGYLVAAPFHAR
ncbi:putative fluoride ion transporter CrcB [Azospirillaceae bacterium]